MSKFGTDRFLVFSFVRRLSRDLQTSAILETLVFDFRCLLSATSEPHRLPACLPWFLSRDSEVHTYVYYRMAAQTCWI